MLYREGVPGWHPLCRESMQLNLEKPLSQRDIRNSTLAFTALALAVNAPLLLIYPVEILSPAYKIVGASSLFWGSLSLIAFHYFWDMYYCYFYPGYLRRWGVFNFLLYGLLSLGIWLLLDRFAKPSILLFLFIGAAEGLVEHVIGIYLFKICEKVPWLHGLATLPLLLFSFVEYLFYWGIVLWLALGIQAIG